MWNISVYLGTNLVETECHLETAVNWLQAIRSLVSCRLRMYFLFSNRPLIVTNRPTDKLCKKKEYAWSRGIQIFKTQGSLSQYMQVAECIQLSILDDSLVMRGEPRTKCHFWPVNVFSH
jgi:hypothetical protein